MSRVLEVEGVRKSFGQIQALAGVDLSVARGEVFGFLGPNGAGKTTLIRILTGFIQADHGWPRILGLDAWRDTVTIKSRIGFLPDVVVFGSGLSGWDFLNYMGRLRGIRGRPVRQAELLERLQLSESALGRKVKGYSSGMAKKLGLVQAMQHDPELLIMDEPTEALDPLIRQAFFDALREARDRGTTVFMSSHVLPDVQEVCGRVGLIRDGRIAGLGSVDSLRQGKARTMEVRFKKSPPAGFEVPGAKVLSREGERWRFLAFGDINEVVRALAAQELLDLVYERQSLDEVFVEYYGGQEGTADD